MTHPKLPLAPFFLWLLRKSLRAYFFGLVLMFVQLPWQDQSLVAQSPPAANLAIGHDFWGFNENAPQGVQAFAQTSDGFLWLGTALGLYRFDGIRFGLFHSPFGDQLASTNIYSLFAPASGGLWIGYTIGGFSFLRDGKVTNYGEIAFSTGSVFNFAQDTNGVLWAATVRGLWKFHHSDWQHIGPEANVPPGEIQEARFDHEGILWAVAGRSPGAELLYLRPGRSQFQTAATEVDLRGLTLDVDQRVVTSPESKRLLDKSRRDSDDVPSAYPVLRSGWTQIVDRTQNVWSIAEGKVVLRRDAPGRLFDALTSEPPSNSESYSLNVFYTSTLVDREGNVWFGEQGGVHRFFYTPLIKQELPKHSYFSVAADEGGAVWITADDGAVSTKPITSILYHVGNEQIRVRKVASDLHVFSNRSPDKTFWFHGGGGLWHMVGTDLIHVDLPKELADLSFYLQAVTWDRQGGMWVSFGRHGLYRLADGVWTSYGGREDLPKTGVLMIEFTDSLGRVWFGYANSQVAVLDGDHVQVFGPNDGIHVGNITAICGRGSEIWIGGEFGLEQFDHGRFHNIQTTDSELLRGISGIVERTNGDLWLNGLGGIFHIRRSEISESLKNPAYRVKGERFGPREGLPGYPDQIRHLNNAIEGTDGRIWFATNGGVVWLDPAHAEKNVLAPPITIQSVSADDQNYPVGSEMKFPARTSSVQISYAATSLLDPAAIRYRYKLEESDKDWHEVASAGPVSYRSLTPGSYHFSVMATDTNGQWSDEVAKAEFAILPTFYQTVWFKALMVIAIAALLWTLYLLRLKRATAEVQKRLLVQVEERERIARELHDTLLQGFQGVTLRVQGVAKNIPKHDPLRKMIDDVLDVADEVLREARHRVRDLRRRTTDANELPDRLTKCGQELAKDHAVTFTLAIVGEPKVLESTVQDEAYRILGEALTNAFRHSSASKIETEVTYDSSALHIRVRDNGVGIDKLVLSNGQPGHWGLIGMRERAHAIRAELKLWSRESAGTEVELVIPASIAYPRNQRKPVESEPFKV
jgi:signal transduction histidine kinase/ligand-binding sensor domain-containing protein